jgi:DNA-binding HxlR family transcriptional regulator
LSDYDALMLGRLYDGQVCSAARALELVGERWSLLIIRNAMFAGMTRFNDFQRSLGVAPNVLTKRLGDFVEAGIFERRPADAGGHEYVLTGKGLTLKPVIVALTEWGDRWAAPDGRPVTYEHEGCGGEVALQLECARCGERPPLADVHARLAPGLRHADRSVAVDA